MSLMSNSTKVRHRALQRAGGVTVSYVRGTNAIEGLKVVPARTRQDDYGPEEFELTGRERDWLLLLSDLVFQGESYMPQRGDAILWTDAEDKLHRYEVLPRSGERCYRHTDQTLAQVRVFTVEVAA